MRKNDTAEKAEEMETPPSGKSVDDNAMRAISEAETKMKAAANCATRDQSSGSQASSSSSDIVPSEYAEEKTDVLDQSNGRIHRINRVNQQALGIVAGEIKLTAAAEPATLAQERVRRTSSTNETADGSWAKSTDEKANEPREISVPGSFPVSRHSYAEAKKTKQAESIRVMNKTRRISDSAIPVPLNGFALVTGPTPRLSDPTGSAPTFHPSHAESRTLEKAVSINESSRRSVTSVGGTGLPLTIMDRSRAHNENRKSRKAAEEAARRTDAGIFVGASSALMLERSQGPKLARGIAHAVAVRGIDYIDEESLENPNAHLARGEPDSPIRSREFPTLLLEPQNSMLLQARIVVEPTLVHAEPMSSVEIKENPEHERLEVSKTRISSTCCLLILAVVAVLVVTASLTGVLLTRSKKFDSNLFDDDYSDDSKEVDLKMVSFLPTYTIQTIVEDDASPQAQAFHWVIQHPKFDTMPIWRKRQLMGLTTLYYSMDGPRWRSDGNVGWLDANINECSWASAPSLSGGSLEQWDVSDDRLDDDTMVVFSNPDYLDVLGQNHSGAASNSTLCSTGSIYSGLSLIDQSLRGSIPPEISLLSDLQVLDLSVNQVTGSLPSELGLLTALVHLSLRINRIGHSLPTQIGNLGALRRVDLSSNELTNQLPSELGGLTKLEVAFLDSNQITGSLPSELGLMTGLSSVSLSSNTLGGSLPSELGKLTLLSYLYLGFNVLSGTLPTALLAMTNLTFWDFRFNQLTGGLPPILGEISQLTGLSLSNNIFTGPIPSQLGKLSQVNFLSLVGNQLTGSIPTELGELEQLTGLGMHSNQLQGSLPSELGRLSNLGSLLVSLNQLTGSIPTEVGKMSSLWDLSAHKNLLKGPLPSELGGLRGLNRLDLSDNMVTSTLPSELGGATLLSTINLSGMRLSGPIPAQIGQLQNLYTMNLSHNTLSGPLPSELGELTLLGSLSLNNNRFTGSVPLTLTNLKDLSTILLSNNLLVGSIPSGVCEAHVGRLVLVVDCGRVTCPCSECQCGEGI